MSSTVKRACDACHRRKVRCNGAHPCRNCCQAVLVCTYNAVPQKKGPKGSRAKVISELRETQKHSDIALKLQSRPYAFSHSSSSSSFSPAPGLLSKGMIDACLDFFFEYMYPTMPILHRQRLQHMIMDINSSVETYCLIASLCAFMMIQPGVKIPESNAAPGEVVPATTFATGTTLLDEVLRVRKGYDYIENPSLPTVITSFFIFGCYFGLDKHNTAWFHLREATTFAQILGMQDESNYATGDLIECSRRRRLYWLLFVTERAYALQRHRPLTLHATIELPTLDEDPSETVALSGFIHLVKLFRPFDDTFVGLWNKTRAGCSTAWLAQLQSQLTEALPTYLNSTESQAADLRTSQQWLRTMVWQLSITNGYLSSNSTDMSMTFKYPIEISRDLVAVTGNLSQQSMEVHGIGLISKLFDVACTLTDVISCVPMDTGTFRVGPRDYLNQFLSLISTLRGGDSRYLPLLLAKINETMPAMAAPIAHSLPLLPANDRIQETYESSESSDSTPYSSPPVPQATGLDFPDLTNGMSSLGTRSVAPYNCASTVATAASLYYTAGAPPLTGVSTVPTGASLYHAADVPLFTGVSTVPTAASLYHTADAPGFSG